MCGHRSPLKYFIYGIIYRLIVFIWFLIISPFIILALFSMPFAAYLELFTDRGDFLSLAKIKWIYRIMKKYDKLHREGIRTYRRSGLPIKKRIR